MQQSLPLSMQMSERQPGHNRHKTHENSARGVAGTSRGQLRQSRSQRGDRQRGETQQTCKGRADVGMRPGPQGPQGLLGPPSGTGHTPHFARLFLHGNAKRDWGGQLVHDGHYHQAKRLGDYDESGVMIAILYTADRRTDARTHRLRDGRIERENEGGTEEERRQGVRRETGAGHGAIRICQFRRGTHEDHRRNPWLVCRGRQPTAAQQNTRHSK